MVPQYEINEERLISFSTTEDVWPEITKAAISEIGDLYGDGFSVWGNWADDTYEVKDIFGSSGVIVSATYKDNDNDFEPGVAGSSDSWEYEDKKGGNVGHHSFAAVLPSSANIPGTLSSTFSKTTNEGIQYLTYKNTLTLNLGSGFDLSENQTDVMCAFQNVDNSNSDASIVQLDFRHLFSTIDVKLNINIPFASQGIAVTNVKLYGIHKSIKGTLQIQNEVTYNSENIKTSEALISSIADCFDASNISTAADPYYEQSYTAGEGFNYESVSIMVVDDLLVYPETFSENLQLYIVIELFKQGKTKAISAKVSSGGWRPGESNTYILQVDPSIFNQEAENKNKTK